MSLILKPLITEKSLLQAGSGVYTFLVPVSTNKIEIGRAVHAQFKVDAVDVRVSLNKGKMKRFKQVAGRRVNTKKAFVKVAPGQKIVAFEVGQEPEAEAKPKKSKKKEEAK